MRNIIRIFRSDLRRCAHSTIGVIVLAGLVIVPVLYAWFNIAGSWDPYGNTGNLKVAVANSDEGYKSELVPIDVNLGDSVVSALRENDQLGWVFVNEDEAVEGVKSGAYYAAVVIPKDFSADMMTLFSSEVKHSSIVYYENQKASAIAPRVTDKGASTVRKQIDETFTKTVGDIGLATASSLLDFMSSDQVANYAVHLSSALGTSVSGLRDAAANAASFSSLLSSSSSLLDSTGSLLKQAGSGNDEGNSLLADANSGLSGLRDALDGAVSTVNTAVGDSSSSFEAVSTALDQAFSTAGDHVDTTVSQLNGISASVSEDAQSMRAREQRVRALKDKVNEGSFSDAIKERLNVKIDAIADGVANVASQQEQIAVRLSAAAADLSSGKVSAEKSHQEVGDLIAQAKDSLATVQSDYDSTLKGQIESLSTSASSIVDASSDIASSLDATMAELGGATSSLAGDLTKVGGVMQDAAGTLGQAADDLQQLKDKLDTAVSSGDVEQIRSLIGSDPQALAEALAAPVALDRQAVYPIKNYGSAMAPFYTVLSLWVGGIVLAAMLKTGVDDARLRQLAPVRLHELYLGRFALFALLALCQATLVCAGDLLFFQIQCQNPWQFLLVGWLTAFVFCNITYTLTVSFGDIGKALAVVLLVMQVAGSGGTFPIEMTADFFQTVYPFLPFTHAINAMHAAMAGAYGAEYWIELGILASYLIPSLALGLVLRRPVVRANEWIIEHLEQTKLM